MSTSQWFVLLGRADIWLVERFPLEDYQQSLHLFGTSWLWSNQRDFPSHVCNPNTCFTWISISSMLMKTTYSCQNFHKLLHFLCHSRRRQEQQQRKLDISNVSFFTSAFKKNVYNRLYNRLQLSFVIWLITVMHGYKDGVLWALKLLSNRFEFFFQHPKFSYVLFSR